MTERPPRAWPLLAPVLALVLLAAHFYRAGAWPWLLATLVLLPLMLLRRHWAPTVLLLALATGAAEWAWTAATLAQQRWAPGQPWLRMVLILGTVSLLPLASALVLRLPTVRVRYRQAQPCPPASARNTATRFCSSASRVCTTACCVANNERCASSSSSELLSPLLKRSSASR